MIPPHDLRKPGTTAITLLELLVTLAILAILALFLFPLVKKTLQTSKTALCMTHLRQLGGAAYLYMNDHQRIIPIRRAEDPVGWQQRLAPYLGLDPETDTVAEVLRCPGDPSVAPKQPRTYRWNLSRNKAGSSVATGSTTLLQLGKLPRLDLIKNTSTHAMLFDITYIGTARFDLWKNNNNTWGNTYDLTSYPPPDRVGLYPRPHYDNQAVNILYYDGHVAMARYPLPPETYYWGEE